MSGDGQVLDFECEICLSEHLFSRSGQLMGSAYLMHSLWESGVKTALHGNPPCIQRGTRWWVCQPGVVLTQLRVLRRLRPEYRDSRRKAGTSRLLWDFSLTGSHMGKVQSAAGQGR